MTLFDLVGAIFMPALLTLFIRALDCEYDIPDEPHPDENDDGYGDTWA